MDIKISHNWLREYLDTKISPKEIGEKLSLSGPSVERINKSEKDYIYDIEVTTNRVDCMSIVGIAREAGAILDKSSFKPLKKVKVKGKTTTNTLQIKIDKQNLSLHDKKLVNRVMAVIMEVEKVDTPKLIKERLEISGMRSLNSIVDITNYIMQEVGHPAHVFDYDLIKDGQINFRLSRKGENITTFDGKTYELPGGDIIIDNDKGNIIDLPGIIGLKNSVVNNNTKRIVFFIDNNDKDKIRKTSTRLGIRTNAAILNEKGVDPELAEIAFARGLQLYEKICKGKVISKIYDIYPKKYKAFSIEIDHKFIEKVIGININSERVIEILEKLGFEVNFNRKNESYLIFVPSWRSEDIKIKEDIVEEIARIYGYQNLPSELPKGRLPEPILDSPFKFESRIKEILKACGGYEIYTNSLTSKEFAGENALYLKNPLGDDSKYLRTTLKPSLIFAANENKGNKEPFFLFEISNVYKPVKNDLPNEEMTLGIILLNYDFRHAKGVIEVLMDELNIENVKTNLEGNNIYWYFESDIATLRKSAKDFKSFKPISKYPAQIEDVTIQFPSETEVGEVINKIKKSNLQVQDVDLVDMYNDYFTFKVWYHNNKKTLNDKEVEKIRNGFLKIIREKMGGVVKS